jgi:hypothetical protein
MSFIIMPATTPERNLRGANLHLFLALLHNCGSESACYSDSFLFPIARRGPDQSQTEACKAWSRLFLPHCCCGISDVSPSRAVDPPVYRQLYLLIVGVCVDYLPAVTAFPAFYMLIFQSSRLANMRQFGKTGGTIQHVKQ